MARYDVHPLPDGAGYLLDVQADILDGLTTRIVVPLMPADAAPTPARVLNPVFDIDAVPHVMATQFIASVPGAILRGPVARLAARSDEITRALDMAFQGF